MSKQGQCSPRGAASGTALSPQLRAPQAVLAARPRPSAAPREFKPGSQDGAATLLGSPNPSLQEQAQPRSSSTEQQTRSPQSTAPLLQGSCAGCSASRSSTEQRCERLAAAPRAGAGKHPAIDSGFVQVLPLGTNRPPGNVPEIFSSSIMEILAQPGRLGQYSL